MKVQITLPDELADCMQTLTINGFSLREFILDALAGWTVSSVEAIHDPADDSPERRRAIERIIELMGSTPPRHHDLQERLSRHLRFANGMPHPQAITSN